MIVVLVAAAAATVAGAVLALSTRDPRTALGGLAILILAAPLVADPLPGMVPLVARVVGGMLAIELLWIAVRDVRERQASGGRTGGGLAGVVSGASVAVDIRVEALAAGAGVVAGIYIGIRYLDAGVPLPGLAPIILGTAFGLLAVAVTPLLISRDTLRLGTGSLVVLVGALLVRGVTGGVQSPLESLVASGLVVAAAAAVAAVMLNAMTAGGDLAFGDTLAIEAETESVAPASTRPPRSPAPALPTPTRMPRSPRSALPTRSRPAR